VPPLLLAELGLRRSTPRAERAKIEARARELVREQLDAELQAIYRKRAKAGKKRFLGVRAIRDQSPFESAGDTFPGFKRNPRIACTNKALRIWLLTQLRAWRYEYRGAHLEWRFHGDHDAVFPYGAVDMPRYHSARIGEPPDPPPREVRRALRVAA